MKKLLFICVVGLSLMSCEKYERVEKGETNFAPIWQERLSVDEEPPDDDTHGGTITDTGVTITDPNDDEDGNGKKKKK